MSEEIKMVVQLVIYPLITALVGVVVALYHRDLKSVKLEIGTEKADREKENDGHNETMDKIFTSIEQINEKLGDIKSKINVQEEVCKLRHKWDGGERRN